MSIKKIEVLKDGYISHYFRTSDTYTWYCNPVFIGSAQRIRVLVVVKGIGPNEEIVSKYLVGTFTTTASITVQGSPSKDINTTWTTLSAPTAYPDTTIEEDGTTIEYVRDSSNLMPWIRLAITLTRNGYPNGRIPCGFGELSASIYIIAEEN